MKFDDYAVVERRSGRNDLAAYDDQIEGTFVVRST